MLFGHRVPHAELKGDALGLPGKARSLFKIPVYLGFGDFRITGPETNSQSK